MQTQKLGAQDIYQFLLSKNFNLTNDKVFRELHPPSDTVWSILVFLCDEIKDKNYDQLSPLLTHLLDQDVHSNSLKKMSEYIIISSVLKKLGFESFYPLI